MRYDFSIEHRSYVKADDERDWEMLSRRVACAGLSRCKRTRAHQG
jgi:hypothetical protein